MRDLLVHALVVSLLATACGGTSTGTNATPDASADAETCTGTQPVVCNGCCGSKYAADQCLDGAWTCRPLGGACVICDAGSDQGLDEGVAGGCGLAGEACCRAGDPGMIAIAPCELGLSCCQATNTCSAECREAGSDAGTASNPCGARNDAGVARSGTCQTGQFCCDQSHTGATSFVCRDAGDPCVPVP